MPKASILVVEDEVIIARDIQQTLIRLGYDVPAMATSAEAALEQVAANRPDLVLMDIHLSGRMDGIEAADIIRQRDALPVVYLTAHSDETTLRRARVTEPYGYVLKPFEERELQIAIDIGLYRHVTDIKLRQMERWLATTLQSIGDAVVATDLLGMITFMNHKAEILTGRSQADVLGRPFQEVVQLVRGTTCEPVESLVERALREGKTIDLMPNTVLKRQDGADIPVDDSAAPIRDDLGEVSGVVIIFRDISARKKAEDQLRHLAVHDALTGLPNRTLLTDRLAIAFEHARRYPEFRFAVLFLDLDRFKVINDSLGHLFGDQVLIAVAQRLEVSLRTGDTVARMGGDEFAILLAGITHVRDVIDTIKRIQKSMAAPIPVNGHDVFTSVSIGITFSGLDYELPENMLRDADTALYRAKALGKNRYCVFNTELHEHATRLLRLETDLRHAIERKEFCIYYQPIVSLATSRLHGFEALLRWQHPERGLILPAEFLTLAEETGLLIPIGQWLLEQACQQTAAWQKEFSLHHPLTIAVNLSHKQFIQANLLKHIAQVLAKSGLEPGQLCLEITEEVIADQETAARILKDLDSLGVQLHIDDFGTGYSSLDMLRHAPIDVLKIDRTFVQPITRTMDEQSAIVRAILSLARELGKTVVAEGIETAEHAALLKAWGCQYGQGYWFAKPLAAKVAAVILEQGLICPPSLN